MNDCQWTFISYLSVCHVCIIIEHIFALRTQMNSTNSIRLQYTAYQWTAWDVCCRSLFIKIVLFLFFSVHEITTEADIKYWDFFLVSLTLHLLRTNIIDCRRIQFAFGTNILIEIIWLVPTLATRAHEFKINYRNQLRWMEFKTKKNGFCFVCDKLNLANTKEWLRRSTKLLLTCSH